VTICNNALGNKDAMSVDAICGGVVSGGIGVTLGQRIDLHVAGAYGGNTGVLVGASLYVLRGRLRPVIGVGVPVFFRDGARAAIRGRVGAEWSVFDRLALTAEIGADRFFNPGVLFPDWEVVPVLGVRVRL
jgi:hypothetical protein